MTLVAIILSLVLAAALPCWLSQLCSVASRLCSVRSTLLCWLRQLCSAGTALLCAKGALLCRNGFALLTLVSFALGAASCAEMHEPEASVDNGGKTYISIQIAPEGAVKSRGYVERDYPEPNDVYPAKDPYADGTNYENTVRSISIFIGNVSSSTADGEKNLTIERAKGEPYFQLFYYSLSTPVNFLNLEGHTYVSQPVPIEAKNSGKKAIYVAVNLSMSQSQAIRDYGIDYVYTFSKNSIEMVADLTSTTYGCAMFCTQPQIFDPATATPGEVTQKSFSLRRCVAKALVTVQKDERGKPIVTAKYEGKPTFEVSDVTYIANALNTRTYLYQHYQKGEETASTPKNLVIDPNFDAFVEMQHFRNRINEWQSYKDFFKEALTHDEARIPTGDNDATCYTEGIYMPENCFDASLAPDLTGLTDEEIAAAQEEFADLAEQNVTHIIVRAFITPIVLKVHKSLGTYMKNVQGSAAINTIGQRIIDAAGSKGDYETFLYTCTGGVLGLSAKDESDLITEQSLVLEEFSGSYDYKSFFTKSRVVTPSDPTSAVTDFYCYSAAKIEYMAENNLEYQPGAATNPAKLEGFTIYDLGYAHYKVYLDVDLDRGDNSQTPGPKPSATDWHKSQIYRNTYYILTVDAFADVAGGIDPSKKTIEVHTQTIPYVQSWQAGIKLDDSDEGAEIVNPVNP